MKNILLIGHSNPFETKFFGGTEYLMQEIISNKTHSDIDVTFMYPKHSFHAMTWIIVRNGHVISSFEKQKSADNAASHEFDLWFAKNILMLDINIVHVFHNLNTPFSVLPIAKLMGLSAVYTIHDFIHVCDSFNLINSDNEFCNVFESQENRCFGCTVARGKSPIELQSRRTAFKSILEDVDLITTGTIYSARATADFYNLELDKFRVVAPKVKQSIPTLQNQKSKAVLILGNLSQPKGAKLVLQLARDERLKGFEYTQAGRVDPEFNLEVKELVRSGNFKTLGQYKLGEVPSTDSSIAFFGSIWPETFCLAATEAIEMGLKLVVPSIGAFIDRFVGKPNCFFYETGQLDSAIEAILVADSAQYVQQAGLDDEKIYSTQILDIYSNLPSLTDSPLNFSDFDSLQWHSQTSWMLGTSSIYEESIVLTKISIYKKTRQFYRLNGFMATVKRIINEVVR